MLYEDSSLQVSLLPEAGGITYEREATKADFMLTRGVDIGLRSAIGAAFGLAMTGTMLSGASSGGLVYFIKLF